MYSVLLKPQKIHPTSLRIWYRASGATSIVLFCCLGCKTKESVNIREPTVLLDDSWNVDYAKNACKLRQAHQTLACIDDPTLEVRNFEAEIATAFAVDELCRGFILAGYQGATSAETILNAQWQLIVDYMPGDSVQHWSLTKMKGYGFIATGTDGPRAAVHTICSVIGHKGGLVR